MVSKRWGWLAAFAVLFAGLTNAHNHVHYCFDGQSAPAAIRGVDASSHAHALPAKHRHDVGHHDEHDSDDHDAAVGPHDDLEVDIPNDALAKTFKHDAPALGAVATWSPELLPSVRAIRPAGPDIRPAPDPRYARPPLRGPPV